MDANDVVENLWFEADTIRRAVAAAYEAVSGPTPMPSSLTQVLAYIAANATSGEGCAAGKSCTTDALLQSAADALNGSHTATGGDALVTEILNAIETVNVGLSIAVPRLVIDEAPAPTVVARVQQVDAGTRLSGTTIDLDEFGEATLQSSPLLGLAYYLANPPSGSRASTTANAIALYTGSEAYTGLTLADVASMGWYIASRAGASLVLSAWSPSFVGGE